MLKIGITGGIGSGKTMVSKIFATLDIPVYDADSAAKQLMNSSPLIREQLIARFGPETYSDKGLNRNYLSTLVFGNNEQLKALNAIVHPVTIEDANQWFQKQSGPYALKEAALIFESKSNQYLDYIIGVTAPEALRIQRTIQRDQVSKEKVLERMARQMPETEKMKLCNFVITNNESQSVISQVLNVHKELVSISKKKV